VCALYCIYSIVLFHVTLSYAVAGSLFQAEIYSGAIFMQQLLGWNMYVCVVIILGVTAVYTIAG